MSHREDVLGALLLSAGVLDQDSLADVLEQQSQQLPLGSLCYALGVLEEETVLRALSRQRGLPGVVFDRSVIALAVLDGIAPALVQAGVLPVWEDEQRLFVACEDPARTAEVLRELELARGKMVVPHLALRITLARTSRACLRARARGESLWAGPLSGPAAPGPEGFLCVVSDVDDLGEDDLAIAVRLGAVGEVTDELHADELIQIDTIEEVGPLGGHALAEGSVPKVRAPGDARSGAGELGARGEPARVLLCDSDAASLRALGEALATRGYRVEVADTGTDALQAIRTSRFDLVLLEVSLPEVDGYEVCRALKSSDRDRHVPVVLVASWQGNDPGRSDSRPEGDADAYFDKPLPTERVVRRIEELIQARAAAAGRSHDSLERALELYRAGAVDAAMEELRGGLEINPLSAKHHFVLGNLLQKKALLFEAIDEYEATVDLEPEYFPALNRLAYLYYKKGFSAKAIDTWRRSLPHCPDPALRDSIETFMRKLIASMASDL